MLGLSSIIIRFQTNFDFVTGHGMLAMHATPSAMVHAITGVVNIHSACDRMQYTDTHTNLERIHGGPLARA